MSIEDIFSHDTASLLSSVADELADTNGEADTEKAVGEVAVRMSKMLANQNHGVCILATVMVLCFLLEPFFVQKECTPLDYFYGVQKLY